MEFNEVIDKRRTSREWTDREVDFETIKRIIGAGMKAPSWDHYPELAVHRSPRESGKRKRL